MSSGLARPQTFGDVKGQDHAVRVLSRLALVKQARNILLHGSVGSGKTTLATIYGRALNCEEQDPDDGSPCGRCHSCRSHEGFFEHDVAGRGGDLTTISTWVDKATRAENTRPFTIFFFDEAHRLDPDAGDSLLKRIEAEKRDVSFIFATTEPSRLSPAIRSRLFDLQVRPLSLAASIDLLRSEATAMCLAANDDVFRVIAEIKGGYPRDLNIALHHLKHLSSVSLAAVKEVFDVDHVDRVLDYFEHLAAGDIPRAMASAVEWPEEGPDKIKWVQLFLLSVYYRDILHHGFHVHAVVDTLDAGRRSGIIAGFRQRLVLGQRPQLIAFWRELLSLWSTPIVEPDAVSALLQFSRFHLMLERWMDHAVPVSPKSTPSPPGQQVADDAEPTRSVATAGSETIREVADMYLRHEDVRRIVNCASFLAQEHNRWFNTAIDIRFEVDGEGRSGNFEDRQYALMGVFWQSFEARAMRLGFYARISVVERGADGLFSLAAVRIEAAPGTSALEELRGWVRAWSKSDGPVRARAEMTASDATAPVKMVKFHWRAVRDLCGGMSEAIEDTDDRGRRAPLRKLLKVTKTRSAGPVARGDLVETSSELSAEAIEKASINQMSPLSCFDDKAWSKLDDGWEAGEFWHRSDVARQRQEDLKIAGDDPAAIARVKAKWPADAKDPVRSWTVWWVQPDEL